MAGKIMHMAERRGRYHARIVVPKDLRAVIGKTELRKPLGGDYRQALRLLPGAVAQLQHEIAVAERKIAATTPGTRPARYPLAPDQIALADYQWRLHGDELARSHPAYAQIGIDDHLVMMLRKGIAGSLTDDELAQLRRVDVHFRRMMVAAMEIKAPKLSSVLQHLVAIPLYSFSFPEKFSIRCRHL